MNVVILGPAHPLRGGLSAFNERLARQFQNEGNSVGIYTFSLQYPSFLFPGTTQFSSEPSPTDIPIKVCINSINPFNWLKIGRMLRKERPDIIVVRYWLPFMGPCLGTILRIVKKNKHTKVICITDNIIPHENRFADRSFTKYFVKPVDGFITMSTKVFNDLKLFEKDKPAKEVTHPLYDNFGEKVAKEEARKKLGIGNDELVVLFFGFIRRYKGLDILLDAMKIVGTGPQPIASCKLLIAGEFYEDRKQYDEQIEKLGIRDRLILHTDFIADSEVRYYLCASDVVIQPYRNATQSGVTPLAYHFERPMIVTNVGGLPALVPNNKVGLVAEADAASIAQKMIEYFEKGEAYFLPGLIEEKKRFSWEKMTTAILKMAEAV